MSRYNEKERIGILKLGLEITETVKWIFREQSVSDVGIDAMIEQCDEEGEPTGKFITVQVKSGVSNVSEVEKGFDYYMSNIHYNYWTNLNLPMIIVLYNEKTKRCYWQEIKKENITKTPTRWKIFIPQKNVINTETRKNFDRVVYQYKPKKQVFDEANFQEDIYSTSVNILFYPTLLTHSLNRIKQILLDFQTINKTITNTTSLYFVKDSSDYYANSLQNIFAINLEVLNQNIANETITFSKFINRLMSSMSIYINFYGELKEYEFQISKQITEIELFLNSFSLETSLIEFKNGIFNLKKDLENIALEKIGVKQAINLASISIKNLLEEIQDAEKLNNELLAKYEYVKNLKQKK